MSNVLLENRKMACLFVNPDTRDNWKILGSLGANRLFGLHGKELYTFYPRDQK